VAQLLIDMPAEGAARLLVLSLLEQLSLHAPPFEAVGATNGTPKRNEAYTAALHRLRASIALYGDVLGTNLPRRACRRLRTLARIATRLHHIDDQLAWLARSIKPEQSENGIGHTVELRDAVGVRGLLISPSALAAEWVCERLTRRRAKLRLQLEQSHEGPRQFRRLAKRLGVYTTAIRLDDMTLSPSFGALTGRQLLAAAEKLRLAVGGIRADDDHRTLRRIRRAADHVVYLLEPVRSHGGVGEVAETARELRDALGSLEALAVVGDALIEGGSRVAARYMMARIRTTVWPPAAHNRGVEITNGQAMVDPPDEIGPGLVSLAESLHAEWTESFAQFAARWLTPDAARFFTEMEQLATALGES